MNTDVRTESDSMGSVTLPADALWGAQTQRAVDNFPVSGKRMPRPFIEALLEIKRAAAISNQALDCLPGDKADAIVSAVDALLGDAELMRHFPVDVFQTGSGTSSNMNANEVIAHRASEHAESAIHPNDHVNFGQSSNDVVPSAISLSIARTVQFALLPALNALRETISRRGEELASVSKTGRTHLMDAMPVRFDQVLGGWHAQLTAVQARLGQSLSRLTEIPLGGTAVGTGINTHPYFAARATAELSERCGIEVRSVETARRFSLMGSVDEVVSLSGELRSLSVSLMKISNDLRWMNSGPLAGLGEIRLPELQPGSSIMPGKVNPVICESVAMVCARVMGNDATIGIAGQSGSFELNVMMPVVADSALESVEILANAMDILNGKAIAGFELIEENIQESLARNPILVTALNPIIGYAAAAAIAKKAYASGQPIIDVAEAETELEREQLTELLDPRKLTEGGL
ncbi:MAG: class II fumarate hydratase [Pseudomonadota bacterium]